jgi:geranylgeranyl diphosphate synthase type I
MSLYTETFVYLSTLRAVAEWDELKTLLQHAISNQPRHWRLPALACEAVGGDSSQAVPAVAALGCLHLAIVLIDDMLDADPKGEHLRLGPASTSNLASALQAAGLEAITSSNACPEVQSAVQNKLNQMLLMTALGQHWDSLNPQDEESYWRVVRAKSSPFFGAALYAGARMGGASAETSAELEKIGHLYGALIQLHDDLNDVMEIPANPDWQQGRSPLPLLFAQVIPHREQARFQQLRQQVSDPDILVEAQEILIRSGAISYTVDQLLDRHQQAEALLNRVELVHMDAIRNLIDETVRPVARLFEQINEQSPP